MTTDQRFRVVAYESQRLALYDREERAFITIRFDESALEILRIPRRKRTVKEKPVPQVKPSAPQMPDGLFSIAPSALPQARPVE